MSDKMFRIKVMGVGGGGSNAVNRMIEKGIEGVDFASINTDIQSLTVSRAPEKVQIGERLTRGLGAGSDPAVGSRAAEESTGRIADSLAGYNLLFLVAGFGGGTGTGATPVIAKIARDMNIMTIAVVTKPFNFEGATRFNKAKNGLKTLREAVDTVIVVPNDRLLEFTTQETSIKDAFHMIDDILGNGIESISSLLLKPGLINLDFADIRSVLTEKGGTLLGYGDGEGKNKEIAAIEAALKSPLLERKGIIGARGVLINYSGGRDLSLHEINSAVGLVSELVHKEANIIFGAHIDEHLTGRAVVTIIATGLDLAYDVELYEEEKKLSVEEKPVQTVINFTTNERGQFAKMDSTLHNGIDLDIPTFLRKKRN
jgi:cell division protein FtsZ